MTGDMTVQARLQSDGVAVRVSNEPPPEGYSKVTKEHLQNLYEREKADLRTDLSENGIGKLAPLERTVGVAVFHAAPEDLVDLVLDYLPSYDRGNLEDQVRDRAPSRLSWARLLARVFQIDISVCRRCGGPMRVIKAVLDPDEIAAELHGARAPPRPSPPGQVELFAG